MPVHMSQTYNVTYAQFITDNETYILDPGAAIAVTPSQHGAGIFEPRTGITFRIEGSISNAGEYRAGVLNSATNSRIMVADGGYVEAYWGIEDTGIGSQVVNDGTIRSVDCGIIIEGLEGGHAINNGQIVSQNFGMFANDRDTGTFIIENNGFIDAVYAIESQATDTRILLGKDSVVHGSGYCTIAVTISGSSAVVDNAGVIRSTGSFAYFGADGGTDAFTNSGKIFGHVALQGGNDTFVMKGGFVTGFVTGGIGDDTFIIKKGDVAIFGNEGSDTIKTAVDTVLDQSAGFETIILTGKKDIDLVADNNANTITGNAGDNMLDGAGGLDILTGGKGRDTFVMGFNDGSDTITDFEQGQDKIAIDGFADFDSFSDLVLEQSGKNVNVVLIGIDYGSALTIEHAIVKDFDKHDFLFV